MLIDVNDLQFVIAFEFGFAKLTDAHQGLMRSGSSPRDVQSQYMFARGLGGQGLFKGPGRGAGFDGFHEVTPG